jgi:ATP-dependent RNA helicase RhlE
MQVHEQYEQLRGTNMSKAALIIGGVSEKAQIQRLRSGSGLVIATPGRLQDLMTRRFADVRQVKMLVLDEADRMLDMGFRPQVDRIFASLAARRQTMLFSATLDRAVLDLASNYTQDAVTHTATALTGEAEHGEIQHEFVPVTHDGKLDTLVAQLGRERGLALVFVRTKHGADKLVRNLARQHKVAAGAMHGNMSQNARERALSAFASGRISTLVATDVAARGLDLDDITHVINFDPPHSHTDYVHRIGRTGRAGRSGNGITFVLPDQADDVRRLANHLGHSEAFAAAGLGTGRGSASPRPARRRRGDARTRRGGSGGSRIAGRTR